jgi:hypothetical protein
MVSLECDESSGIGPIVIVPIFDENDGAESRHHGRIVLLVRVLLVRLTASPCSGF